MMMMYIRSKAGKRKTKVKKHTLNPVFEEILKVGGCSYFHISSMKYWCYFIILMISFNGELSVCDATGRGGKTDDVDLSVAQVGRDSHNIPIINITIIMTIMNLASSPGLIINSTKFSAIIPIIPSDMFGRNDFLGEVMLPMSGQLFDDPSSQWFSLQDRV